jgi:hypothetical protein
LAVLKWYPILGWFLLFVINVFKGKLKCHSINGTVGIDVTTRKMKEFHTFSVSSALRYNPSALESWNGPWLSSSVLVTPSAR